MIRDVVAYVFRPPCITHSQRSLGFFHSILYCAVGYVLYLCLILCDIASIVRISHVFYIVSYVCLTYVKR